MSERCDVEPHRLVELLGEGSEGGASELRAHVRRCPSCRQELEALQGEWEGLPASMASSPPDGVGRSLLEEARDAVASPGVPWGGLRRVAFAVGLGAVGAGLLVLGLGLRGHLTVAVVVTVLAAPFHGLQLGAGNIALVLSALLGLGLGALAGASVGSVVRRRRGARSVG